MKTIRYGFGYIFALILIASLHGCGGGSSEDTPDPSGTLTVTGCFIADGESACDATISWTTQNSRAPTVSVGATNVSEQATGTVAVEVGFGTTTVTLADLSDTLDQVTLEVNCVSTSDWDGNECSVVAIRYVEFAPTSFVENGNPISLEVVFYRPMSPGQYPTIMFNHGSTGDGSDPASFTQTFTAASIVRYFTRRGWIVAFPQRRGRGQSGGTYDEGFTPDRSGYSCVEEESLPGIDRALADLDAAVDFLASRAEVDSTRLLSGGFSRGGLLAVLHPATRPTVFLGSINFAGGWLGEGCGDALEVNRQSFLRGSSFAGESLWIYAENDSFYTIAHSRSHFDAFVADGGNADFIVHSRESGLNGHYLINDLDTWENDLDSYLLSLP